MVGMGIHSHYPNRTLQSCNLIVHKFVEATEKQSCTLSKNSDTYHMQSWGKRNEMGGTIMKWELAICQVGEYVHLHTLQ